MTAAPREKLTDRFMKAVFGKPVTSENTAFAEQAKPPRAVRTAFFVIEGVALVLMLATLLWSYGRLPFVESKIDRSWVFWPWGLALLFQFLWEWVRKDYERRAAARMKCAR